MPLAWNERRRRAIRFANEWTKGGGQATRNRHNAHHPSPVEYSINTAFSRLRVIKAVIAGLICGVLCSCATESTPSEERMMLRLNVINPPLLPVEKRHTVALKFNAKPIDLDEADVSAIVELIGRIPGLYAEDYEIWGINNCMEIPGAKNVGLLRHIVRVKKDAGWQVLKIIPRSCLLPSSYKRDTAPSTKRGG